MAGHSHWAQVKHKKAVVDAKRGQMISKLIRAITIAAREGTNPDTNFKLRSAIDRAKEFQVPLENIERAIKKSEAREDALEEVIFEAYLNDVQILIKTITDNKNRALGEIKHLLNRFGGRLAEPGSVIWNFKERAVFVIDKKDEEKIFEIMSILEDFYEKDGNILLITNLSNFNTVKNHLEKLGISIKESLIEFSPINSIGNLDEVSKKKLEQLTEALLDLDDVEEVFTNTKD
jgi:YebC/PmpR family DNA-binding regulatory protein